MASSGDQNKWDEERMEEAMRTLKTMHIQARKLRDTIPKIVDPLVQKQPSPDAMLSAFTKAVDEAQSNLKEFSELMRDDESKEIFARAKESREANPQGIVPWKHEDHPDWFKEDTKS